MSEIVVSAGDVVNDGDPLVVIAPCRVADRSRQRLDSRMTGMAIPPFGRLLTAMVTPFTPRARSDLDAAARLATYLVDDLAHDGLVISGTAASRRPPRTGRRPICSAS